MENITLNVQGMSCGHCVKAVETSVGALAGVQEVKVDLAEAKVTVAFDEAVWIKVIVMLDMEMARKAYQERIDSESYSDRNYTEEEKKASKRT